MKAYKIYNKALYKKQKCKKSTTTITVISKIKQ